MQSGQNKTGDKIEILVVNFCHIVLMPAIMIGFIISVVFPGARITVSDILMKGFFMFVGLAVVYFTAAHYKSKR